MTIITQDNELINYENVKAIVSQTVDMGDVNVYAIFALDTENDCGNMDEVGELLYSHGVHQLGVYANKDEQVDVLNKIIAAIVNDNRIFQMPESAFDEDDETEE